MREHWRTKNSCRKKIKCEAHLDRILTKKIKNATGEWYWLKIGQRTKKTHSCMELQMERIDRFVFKKILRETMCMELGGRTLLDFKHMGELLI